MSSPIKQLTGRYTIFSGYIRDRIPGLVGFFDDNPLFMGSPTTAVLGGGNNLDFCIVDSHITRLIPIS